ncbi:MAG: 4-hydroxyphenylpyruvate dioxygenase-like putative hemolysin, partial [Clostridium sp.]
MKDMIIPNFWDMHLAYKEKLLINQNFLNNDELLKIEAKKIKEIRVKLGLHGIVGDLQYVLINTEIDTQEDALKDFLKYTGHDLYAAMENQHEKIFVLKNTSISSADFLIKARKKGENPYLDFNIHPSTKHLPNTRLEAFVFKCSNIKKYYEIQKSRGVNFLTDCIIETDNYYYIQTTPSSFTGFSYGLIEWKNEEGNYSDKSFSSLNLDIKKPSDNYVNNIKALDHAATRILSKDRDAAILELMELTNYNFDFAIYVKSMNSITSVARVVDGHFAMVFTSGIKPYVSDEESGPTEKFVSNYGSRVHHLAFHTEHIEYTFEMLKEKEMTFLIGLIGSPKEGLKKTFSYPSKNTFLVNEYIYRYDG